MERLFIYGTFQASGPNEHVLVTWMTDYQSVVKGVYAALKPNSRFIGELGKHGNIQCFVNAMRDRFTENFGFSEFYIP